MDTPRRQIEDLSEFENEYRTEFGSKIAKNGDSRTKYDHAVKVYELITDLMHIIEIGELSTEDEKKTDGYKSPLVDRFNSIVDMLGAELDAFISGFHKSQASKEIDQSRHKIMKKKLNHAEDVLSYLKEIQVELRKDLNELLERNDPIFDYKNYEKQLEDIELDLKNNEDLIADYSSSVGTSATTKPSKKGAQEEEYFEDIERKSDVNRHDDTQHQVEQSSSPESQYFEALERQGTGLSKNDSVKSGVSTTDTITPPKAATVSSQQSQEHDVRLNHKPVKRKQVKFNDTIAQDQQEAEHVAESSSAAQVRGFRERFKLKNGDRLTIKVDGKKDVISKPDNGRQQPTIHEAESWSQQDQREETETHRQIGSQQQKPQIHAVEVSPLEDNASEAITQDNISDLSSSGSQLEQQSDPGSGVFGRRRASSQSSHGFQEISQQQSHSNSDNTHRDDEEQGRSRGILSKLFSCFRRNKDSQQLNSDSAENSSINTDRDQLTLDRRQKFKKAFSSIIMVILWIFAAIPLSSSAKIISKAYQQDFWFSGFMIVQICMFWLFIFFIPGYYIYNDFKYRKYKARINKDEAIRAQALQQYPGDINQAEYLSMMAKVHMKYRRIIAFCQLLLSLLILNSWPLYQIRAKKTSAENYANIFMYLHFIVSLLVTIGVYTSGCVSKRKHRKNLEK
ncbi:hypothetical protein H4219_000536 [Mycoemilia scoparia]|uniref:Uncharacterized protein n=1 Tax=Mycoemilia scoparia TaxID=417184 RepID=A0A9W8A366_9FUNG|nr:hypothetical protein H4219_000536 [Mycoemilia scoparia]